VSVAPIVSATDAPPGTEKLAVQWIKVAVPDLGVMLAAVARPSRPGPFPSVILLHGADGFAREYVQWAQDLAHDGLLAVAACWFSGGGGSGSGFVTPIPCPQAPAFNRDSHSGGIRALEALEQATRGLLGARPDRLGLVGHSRGAGLILAYLLQKGSAQAVVLHSAGYANHPGTRAADFNVPILILHGTADPAEGGTPSITDFQNAREFEAALRRENKPVEVSYAEGGGHNSFFINSTQRDAEMKRMVAFLLRRLGT
jgi:dienelactone hydrolase